MDKKKSQPKDPKEDSIEQSISPLDFVTPGGVIAAGRGMGRLTMPMLAKLLGKGAVGKAEQVGVGAALRKTINPEVYSLQTGTASEAAEAGRALEPGLRRLSVPAKPETVEQLIQREAMGAEATIPPDVAAKLESIKNLMRRSSE